jgi:hypothetical protein
VAQFAVRPASADDAEAVAELFAAVAGERDGIVTEPPVDGTRSSWAWRCRRPTVQRAGESRPLTSLSGSRETLISPL